MKTRVTNIILIIMLLLNVAFIGSWWMSHSKMHRTRHSMFEGFDKPGDKGLQFLMKQLNFNNDQQAQAEKIFSEHIATMQKYQLQIESFQKQIFKCLAQDTPDSVHAFMYADSVGMLRVSMQKEFFRNSFRIRQVCNPEQKKRYDALMQDIVKRLGHNWARHNDTAHPDSV